MTHTSIQGIVITGKNRGREIGYPTANVKIPKEIKESCQEGTYAGKVTIGSKAYRAAMFIPQRCDIIETYIIDYEGDLYGKEISLTIGRKLRNNKKFENLQALKTQIAKDVWIVEQSALTD